MRPNAPTPLAPDEPPVVTGSREQLLHLLAEASEIEHTLMCCYLYAAFSLKKRGEADLSEDQADAVMRWRKAIMDVAVEEMGHLVIVANLTVSLGGRPHFGRPNFPISPGYFPSGVVVRLAGFSKETLDHFIFLERPQGDRRPDSEAFEQEEYRREQAVVNLMPSAQDYKTIGHLYEAIRANIDRLAADLGGERNLFIGLAHEQLGPDMIDLEGVAIIDGIASAHAALDAIIDQGEGSQADREESHFKRFTEIREELEALTSANPEFRPAWPVADNPVMRRPPDPEGRVFIEATEPARYLDFACASYGLLLRMLVQCFGRRDGDVVATQKKLFEAALLLMHALGTSAEALARLPAAVGDPTVHAGMSFTMLRGIEPLIGGRTERLLLREQLMRLHAGGRMLSGFTGFDTQQLAELARTSFTEEWG